MANMLDQRGRLTNSGAVVCVITSLSIVALIVSGLFLK